MLLRARRRGGRFGLPWESRTAPGAGGLHPIAIIALPLEEQFPSGWYDPHEHCLQICDEAGLLLNKTSIETILETSTGTTLQFAADAAKYDACYENAGSLMWRDAGALTTTICFVATALGLEATPVGRIGDDIVRACGLHSPLTGAGAVHLGAGRLMHEED